MLVVAVVAALVVRTFVVQVFRVPSGSMLPTLQIGDRLVVDKLPGLGALYSPRRHHCLQQGSRGQRSCNARPCQACDRPSRGDDLLEGRHRLHRWPRHQRTLARCDEFHRDLSAGSVQRSNDAHTSAITTSSWVTVAATPTTAGLGEQCRSGTSSVACSSSSGVTTIRGFTGSRASLRSHRLARRAGPHNAPRWSVASRAYGTR